MEQKAKSLEVWKLNFIFCVVIGHLFLSMDRGYEGINNYRESKKIFNIWR